MGGHLVPEAKRRQIGTDFSSCDACRGAGLMNPD